MNTIEFSDERLKLNIRAATSNFFSSDQSDILSRELNPYFSKVQIFQENGQHQANGTDTRQKILDAISTVRISAKLRAIEMGGVNIHAAAIANTCKKGVLITAKPGGGKTTALQGILPIGHYDFVTNDQCILRQENNFLRALSYPAITRFREPPLGYIEESPIPKILHASPLNGYYDGRLSLSPVDYLSVIREHTGSQSPKILNQCEIVAAIEYQKCESHYSLSELETNKERSNVIDLLNLPLSEQVLPTTIKKPLELQEKNNFATFNFSGIRCYCLRSDLPSLKKAWAYALNEILS
ncbi:phosphoenolpyruvate carboxykinase (ATP) [Rhodobium gokarnense]|uniref:Serine kinase of HPr protein (Carbohydrate metabolism regulator) n=1 Tax=Rhodobium gokarnense TaxID=364296 RepID=A0ABT3HAG7_9HYPH|nr:hypothetical protein [Rhodobium gokarnense]MCW2307387.1 serine kinase of HPr protein (carbohydrate metabolism regulator) [Rhodobium gokarnense]